MSHQWEDRGEPSTRVQRPFGDTLTMAGLFIIGVMSYIDRTAVSVLQIPIKIELGLSDTQLGAITGMAFALMYTGMAIPIARYADRSNRKLVIIAALCIWSVMTALSGFATSFLALIMLRMGVAFGESGSVPATHSMIADLYPPERRARAVALCGLCVPVGMVAALVIAGRLSDAVGWRAVFWVLGGSGLILVPLLLWAMREPLRGTFDGKAAGRHASLPLWSGLRVLWQMRTFRYVAMGGAVHAFVQYSIMTWSVPFYARVHHLPIAQASDYVALLNGVGSALGIWLGGWFTDRLGGRDIRWRLRVPSIAMVLMVPLAAVQYLVASPVLSLLVGMLPSALMMFYFSSIVAVPMLVIGPHMRAFASAVKTVTFNIVGLGLGPLLTGAISDFLILSHEMADDSLRYALLIILSPSLLAPFLFLKGSTHLPNELLQR